MSYTKERLERVLFSIPYADASQALLIRSADKDKIKTIADMSGKVLGIKLGSPGETLKNRLETQLKTERGAGFKDVKTYDDHPAAYLALGAGQRRRRPQHGADAERRAARQAGRVRDGAERRRQQLARLRVPQGGHRDRRLHDGASPR